MKNELKLNKYFETVEQTNLVQKRGKINQLIGLTIEANGPMTDIGKICNIYSNQKTCLKAEVVGFKNDKIILMPLGDMEGIGPGSEVVETGEGFYIKVGEGLLGRIIDGLGNPIDGKSIDNILEKYPVMNKPPKPLERKTIDSVMSVGIKAIDGLITCGKGQRMGIFAGSGVGKSTLLGMIARNTQADINVVALIGERGREVKEFIENDLGKEGLKRSIVIVATSDQPALIRNKGAFVATAIAEYFRDQGKDVMLLMDSITRLAMAQREVGLAVGEPPVSRGYTPSVFAQLPKLLERAGSGKNGTITALYTVLVDGDDLDEPITDAVRGILDGHIVLSRELANKNHFPSIDVLKSISRKMIDIVPEEQVNYAGKFKDLLASYNEAEDLINIGAYSKGSNPKIDKAIEKIDQINDFLQQGINESFNFEETGDLLRDILK